MLRVDSLWETADDIICGDIFCQRVSGIMLMVRWSMITAVMVGPDDDGSEHDDADDDADILLLRMVAISTPRKWSWLVVV